MTPIAEQRPMTEQRQTREPIAIVGVSALFPGSTDAQGFWQDILDGRDLVTDVPATHWLIEDYYDPDPKAPDKTYAKRGAFLPEVPFDPMAFGVPPSIVPATDTSQLLGLIVAQRVLEDAAGGQFADMNRDRISVILGVTSGQELLASMVSRLQRPVWSKSLREAGIPEDEVVSICDRIAAHYVPWQESSFPGLLGNVVAGRIANRLDLGGTNCVTDAACASAFSAISMAISELETQQADLVVTGGVDALNDIFMYMCFSKTPALSPTGDCRPFSDNADGTLLGEGLGMVALKRLADAERDGDRIYAVIRGIGSSSDGRAKSVYAPVPEGQAKALRRAYATAGYDADTVELVEAHGTATKAGDAAEFEGLRQAFTASGRTDKQWCALGSVKSQIGHTKAASGAAGLFKAVMALQHRVLPPTIKVERPNAQLRIEESPFYLNTETRPWVRPSDHPRRVGVSSFGFGGSNFHITAEEYNGDHPALRHRAVDCEVVVFAEPTADALLAKLKDLDLNGDGVLGWLARDSQERYAASVDGSQARLAVVARDDDDLQKKIASAVALIEANPNTSSSHPRGIEYGAGNADTQVAMLFPGQGSQYVGMGGALAGNYPEAIAAWDAAADVELGGGAQLRIDQVVFPHPVFDEDARTAQQQLLTRTEWAQPAIGTASLALWRVVRSLGLQASCVGGHSFGELTALHAAGAIDEASFLRLARRRGELMAEAAATPGAMIAVSASREEVSALIAKHGADVVVANHNAPTQVVLSGSVQAIEAFEKVVTLSGLSAKRLPVATAFHSAIVAPTCEPFANELASVALKAPSVPVYANSSAAPYPSEPGAIAATLADQIRSPVRFVEQIEAMYDSGARVFLEVGPGSVLTGLVGRILDGRPHTAITLDRKGKKGLKAWHTALAKLVARGVVFDMTPLWQAYRPVVDPRSVSKPKLTLEITGSNYGKPYPPPEGAAGLPAPNPPSSRNRITEEIHVKDINQTAPSSNSSATTSSSATSHATTGNGASRDANGVAVPDAHGSVVTTAAVAPMMSPVAAGPAWLYAYQEAQRQTAEAHTAFQNAMAQAHIAFLQTAERGIAGLTAMTTGAPLAQLGATAGYVPQQLSTPLNMPVMQAAAAPAMPVQAMPVQAMPVQAMPVQAMPVQAMPVQAMPVQAMPVKAQAPVMIPAAPAPAPQPAPARTAPPVALAAAAPAAPGPTTAAPIDAEALLLEVVADKTGYPTEMLELSMALEADLGIDSIKRVEILSAMMKQRPDLPQVDTKVMAALNTLGEIVAYMNDHIESAAGGSDKESSHPKASSAATP